MMFKDKFTYIHWYFSISHHKYWSEILRVDPKSDKNNLDPKGGAGKRDSSQNFERSKITAPYFCILNILYRWLLKASNRTAEMALFTYLTFTAFISPAAKPSQNSVDVNSLVDLVSLVQQGIV